MRYLLPVVAASALLSLSCGGDDRLSEDEYFSAIEEIRVESERESVLAAAFNDSISAESADEHLRAHIALVDAVVEHFQFVDRLASLQPPEHLESEHQRLVETSSEWSASISSYRDDLEGVAVAVPLAPAAYGSVEAAEQAELEACSDMSERADELGFDIGFNCEPDLLLVEILSCSALGTDIPCDPSAIEVVPGVFGRLAQLPPVPAGLRPVTLFLEFAALDDRGATIVIPSVESVTQDDDPAFYSFVDGGWVLLAPATVTDDGINLQADFGEVPENVIVLVSDEAET